MRAINHRLVTCLSITISLFLISCKPGKNPVDDEDSPARHQISFLIMISNQQEEMQAGVLIKSIRKFGGTLANEPVILVRSNQSDALGLTIENEADYIVDLEMDEELRNFPFSDKVFACAQIEEMVEDDTEWLLWLNPDAILFEPPDPVIADEMKWVSLRPVHHRNVGSAFSDPVSGYWKRIYLKTGVDTASLWPVESFVDKQELRPYYNSGCMAFRPDKGLLRLWKAVYCSMLKDTALYQYYSADNNRSVFLHQAVLSAVITATGKEKINILPASYSYPLVLQNMDGFSNRIDSIPGISLVLCGSYENLNQLKIAEPYKTWIRLHAFRSL